MDAPLCVAPAGCGGGICRVRAFLQLQNQIDELRAEIKENNDTMQYYLRLNHNLDTDPATLERIVRERYHMQRPNEDVYLVD